MAVWPGATRERVLELLDTVPDPEIPVVSVVDLGIVREVDPARSVVRITPTYSGCPATMAIERSIRDTLDAAGLEFFAIETVLSPPWSTDWISAAGLEKLRAYGIAPPPQGASRVALRAGGDPVACPRCASHRTEEISRFGSTPCKALWRCVDCLEPFDRFKCH